MYIWWKYCFRFIPRSQIHRRILLWWVITTCQQNKAWPCFHPPVLITFSFLAGLVHTWKVSPGLLSHFGEPGMVSDYRSSLPEGDRWGVLLLWPVRLEVWRVERRRFARHGCTELLIWVTVDFLSDQTVLLRPLSSARCFRPQNRRWLSGVFWGFFRPGEKIPGAITMQRHRDRIVPPFRCLICSGHASTWCHVFE